MLLGQFLGLPAVPFKEAPIRHAGIEHLQGAAAGVDLVVMGQFGEAFEVRNDPRSGTAQDLHIAGAALRLNGPNRVGNHHLRRPARGEGAQRSNQMLRLALAGLPGS